jgi:hypothetical protein
MSLSARLQDSVNSGRPGLPCRLGSLLRGDEFPKDEKEYLEKILDVELGDPKRIPTTSIAQALRQEGYLISVAAVQRHRRKQCRCYGSSPKYSKGTEK